MPALIYLIYSFTHVVVDTYKGLYNTAMIEIWVGIVFTLLLNIMCQQGLGIVSWLIISIPFILMTVIASMLLFMFRLNPATGQVLDSQTQPEQTTQSVEPQPTQATPAQTTQSAESQPTQATQSVEPQPAQTTPAQPQPLCTDEQTESLYNDDQPSTTSNPSRYSYPISVYYGSLGNSSKPVTTR